MLASKRRIGFAKNINIIPTIMLQMVITETGSIEASADDVPAKA